MRSKKILLAIVSLAAASVIVELSATALLRGRWQRGVIPRLQWLDVGVREPHRGWTGRPGWRTQIIGQHEPYRIAHDSRGYRQPEQRVERSGGVVRVLALGDSIVYGWGAEAVTIVEAQGSEVTRGTSLHIGSGQVDARANELIAEGLLPTLRELLGSR